jgi:hypothetical protein
VREVGSGIYGGIGPACRWSVESQVSMRAGSLLFLLITLFVGRVVEVDALVNTDARPRELQSSEFLALLSPKNNNTVRDRNSAHKLPGDEFRSPRRLNTVVDYGAKTTTHASESAGGVKATPSIAYPAGPFVRGQTIAWKISSGKHACLARGFVIRYRPLVKQVMCPRRS